MSNTKQNRILASRLPFFAFSRQTVVFALFAGLMAILSGCFPPFDKFDKRQTVEVEEKISQDPRYREMDDICKTVKLIEEVELVGKSRLFNSVGIIYFYRTRVEFDKVEAFVLKSMTADGWKSVQSDYLHRELFFRKDTNEVTVQFGGISSDIDIGITCTKLRDLIVN